MASFSVLALSHGTRPKTSCLPSGDQPGSSSFWFSESISCGVPPCADIKKILQSGPARLSTYAICVLSGDQRGRKAETGGDVSCRRSLPSTPLRHKGPSETYTTHLPSREESNSPAEIPPINGTK